MNRINYTSYANERMRTDSYVRYSSLGIITVCLWYYSQKLMVQRVGGWFGVAHMAPVAKVSDTPPPGRQGEGHTGPEGHEKLTGTNPASVQHTHKQTLALTYK